MLRLKDEAAFRALAGRGDRWSTTVQIPPPDRKSKFSNEKVDGHDSRREAKRIFALRLMEKAGQIRDLRTARDNPEDCTFLLIPPQRDADGTLIERQCAYVADAVYDEWTADGWRSVVEDAKGYRTKDYTIKRKLMLFVHHIRVRET